MTISKCTMILIYSFYSTNCSNINQFSLSLSCSNDDTSKGGLSVSTAVKGGGRDGGHVWVKGDIDSIEHMDPDDYKQAVDLAKLLENGKNFNFMNFWMVLNKTMPCENGFTSALHVKKQVPLGDEGKWKMSFCAPPDNNVLMIQGPSLDKDEDDDLLSLLSMLTVETE